MAIGTPQDLGHNQSATTASLAITTTNGVSAGDLIVVCHYANNNTGTISGITDTAGNTYVVGSSQTTAPMAQIWYALNATAEASSSTITVNFNGGGALRHGVSAFRCSGILTASAVDIANVSATGTATSSGALTFPTLNVPNELAVVMIATAATPGTVTWASGFAAVGGNTATAFALPSWLATTSTAGFNGAPSWVNSISYRTLGMSFKGTDQPAGGSGGGMGMMGMIP